jgi:lactoylglutathione lyase
VSSEAKEPFDPTLWVWGQDAVKPRVLHTMIRVKDFAAAVHFYVDLLGMKMLDRYEIPVRRVSAVFVGFDGYDVGGCIEIVRPWDSEGPFTHGTGYGHICIGVPDVVAMLDRLEANGVEVTTRPTILLPGGPCVAFVKDPDGYAVELVQTRR